MIVGTFVKRPVEITARQWDGTVGDATEIIQWILDNDGTARFVGTDEHHPMRRENEIDTLPFIVIDTLEGPHRTDPYDHVLQGVKGEFYPCKHDIFQLTYEEVVDIDELPERDRLALLRFTEPNFAVKDARQNSVIEFRRHFYRAALAIILAAPESKSRAVALTELETAMMWAVKAYFGAPGESHG